MSKQKRKSGFTLLELLIVITILAILTLVVVLFINPVEMLKKSRDVQRMSDLSTVNAAIGLYLQDSTSNNLGGTTNCVASTASDGAYATNNTRISIATSTAPSLTLTKGNTGTTCTTGTNTVYNATTTGDLAKNNGSGWISVNFSSVSSGAPIAKLPIDPINTAVTTGTCGIDSLYYRYACKTNNTFEMDATLESAAYGPGSTDDKAKTDGGNSEMRYEVGTDLRIIPSSAPLL